MAAVDNAGRDAVVYSARTINIVAVMPTVIDTILDMTDFRFGMIISCYGCPVERLGR